MDTLVGYKLGKYQLETLVGRGGMATVYRAHDTSLNRAVAIKVLDPGLAVDPRAVERFKREAVTSANLEHPNIVCVYDVQQEGHIYYIAMRFVQGHTLRDILQDNGPLPLGAVVNVITPLAQALQYAHLHGVIHRDVKPGNILVEPDGSVLLTDFGIARAADNAQSGLTATGLVMGTADYLAPEQISGRPAEPRSDIYSLGVVLYEMLTGVTPFAGENTASILYRQVHDNPPSLRSMNPRLPIELQPVMDRVLAKNPSSRYSDPVDLARDLEEVARWLPDGSPWLSAKSGGSGQNGNGTWHSTEPKDPYAQAVQKRGDGAQAGVATYAHDDSFEDYKRQTAPYQESKPKTRAGGRRTMMLFFALFLLGIGGLVLAQAAGVLPKIKLGGGTNAQRFSPPGPVTYTGQKRKDNGPDIHVPQALLPLTIDGDLSDWQGAEQWAVAAPSITFINPNVKDLQWNGPNDLSATFNYAWDDTYFYVGAVVTDETHVQNTSTRNYDLYKGDDIEIWFDTDLAGDFQTPAANGDDYQIGLSPGDFASLGPQAVFWNPDKNDARNKSVTVAAQQRPGGNGYRLEAAIPWSALGSFRPEPGAAIGFAASAGDNDRPDAPRQELMISTTPRLQYRQPFTFGNLYF